MAVFNEILWFYIIFLTKIKISWYYFKVKIFPICIKSVEFKRSFKFDNTVYVSTKDKPNASHQFLMTGTQHGSLFLPQIQAFYAKVLKKGQFVLLTTKLIL